MWTILINECAGWNFHPIDIGQAARAQADAFARIQTEIAQCVTDGGTCVCNRLPHGIGHAEEPLLSDSGKHQLW